MDDQTDPAMNELVKRVLSVIGPFKFYIWHHENYSGEHRRWKEEYTLPVGSQLAEEILKAAIPVLQSELAATHIEAKFGANRHD